MQPDEIVALAAQLIHEPGLVPVLRSNLIALGVKDDEIERQLAWLLPKAHAQAAKEAH